MRKSMRRTKALATCIVLVVMACSSSEPDDVGGEPSKELPNDSSRGNRTIIENSLLQEVPESFSATFVVSGGRRVKLHYLDDENFELSPVDGGFTTIVADGSIFVRQSNGGPTSESYLIAQMRPWDAIEPIGAMPELSTQPTSIPAAGIVAWGLAPEQVRDMTLQTERLAGEGAVYTVAPEPRLARAQWMIVNRMIPAMAMELCSDDVRSLALSWPAGLIDLQRAILASTAGMRLDGRIGKLEKSVDDPKGAVFETAGSILQRQAMKPRGKSNRPSK